MCSRWGVEFKYSGPDGRTGKRLGMVCISGGKLQRDLPRLVGNLVRRERRIVNWWKNRVLRSIQRHGWRGHGRFLREKCIVEVHGYRYISALLPTLRASVLSMARLATGKTQGFGSFTVFREVTLLTTFETTTGFVVSEFLFRSSGPAVGNEGL